MLLVVEFNNKHLDTSFASIDPKIIKHPIEGTPRNLKTAVNPIDQGPLNQGVHPFGHLFVIYICETGSEGSRRMK